MICEKCAGKVNDNGKCSLCGYDNINVQPPKNYDLRPKFFRSTRVTVFMYLVIALNLIVATMLIQGLSRNNGLSTGTIVASVVSILLCVLEIIVACFILRLKKWALISYIFLSIVGGIIQLFNFELLPIIFKALLLYFIFRNDWEYFD